MENTEAVRSHPDPEGTESPLELALKQPARSDGEDSLYASLEETTFSVSLQVDVSSEVRMQERGSAASGGFIDS